MISFICAVNNDELAKKMLINSLSKQTSDQYELVLIHAQEYGFTSASQTLNYGASIAKGDIFIFIHQDIEFQSSHCVEDLLELCNKYEFAIAGVAGVSLLRRKVYSSVEMDFDHRIAGIQNTKVRTIDTLDECLLIIKRSAFQGFADYGDTWHFYGVDYSLRSALNDESVLLFPIQIYHLSPGWSLDHSYWKTLKLLKKRYKKLFKVIPTTMGIWTFDLYGKFKILKYRLFMLIRKVFHLKKI